ncbi:MAG: Smr domain-containing protein [Gammaproteobacteria bacterium BRH_c0]|nr:MAG: Smr domain-containing protein [Gammaproteobacteria bacterium BRH_c0]
MNDESSLFKEFVGDVEPLRTAKTVDQPSKKIITPGMQERRRAAAEEIARSGNYLAGLEYIQPVKPWDELTYKRDGVQHGVFKSLRQGKYSLDARLDLHRMTVEQARQEVLLFVNDCVDHNIRCAIIAHGRGELRDNPALLKSCVNHWLRQIDAVLAFHSAQRHHGGVGATYVLMRKSDEKRLENKEIYSRRQS